MTQYFTEANVGKRYATYRPKVHHLALQWLEQAVPGRRFSRAVDVACGTGDSTLPLLQIADAVLGIDSSEEMLDVARASGLNVRKSDYKSLAEYGRFDLICTCMAFHWFDATRAIAAYKTASTPGAIWLIYNFWFGGHSTSDEFNRWLHHSYLHEYPSPPRNPSSIVKPESDPEVHLLAGDTGCLPIEFTHDSLVGYLSTQSNIEQSIRQGRSLDDIQESLRSRLASIDISGAFKYKFTYEILEYTAGIAEEREPRSTCS